MDQKPQRNYPYVSVPHTKPTDFYKYLSRDMTYEPEERKTTQEAQIRKAVPYSPWIVQH